jgi:hypothetical protein
MGSRGGLDVVVKREIPTAVYNLGEVAQPLKRGKLVHCA